MRGKRRAASHVTSVDAGVGPEIAGWNRFSENAEGTTRLRKEIVHSFRRMSLA